MEVIQGNDRQGEREQSIHSFFTQLTVPSALLTKGWCSKGYCLGFGQCAPLYASVAWSYHSGSRCVHSFCLPLRSVNLFLI